MLDLMVERIAMVCHQTNKAYCEMLGDYSQPEWKDAPEWQRQSAINGVKFHILNPDVDASASHQNWLAEKETEGWKYGPVKDVYKKEHPCFVPFDKLPPEQQAKDKLFKGVVDSLREFAQ